MLGQDSIGINTTAVVGLVAIAAQAVPCKLLGNACMALQLVCILEPLQALHMLLDVGAAAAAGKSMKRALTVGVAACVCNAAAHVCAYVKMRAADAAPHNSGLVWLRVS